jgi:hypothetical protein
MTDDERLEAITSCFISGLLHYGGFVNKERYKDLIKRIEAIIEMEIDFQDSRRWNTFLMTAWGGERN